MKIYRIRGNYYNGKRVEAVDLEEEDSGDDCEDPEKSAAGGEGGRPIWEKFFAFNPKWIRTGSAAPKKRRGGGKPSKGKKKHVHLDLPEAAPADEKKPADDDDPAAGKKTSSDEDLQQPAAGKFKFPEMAETEDEEEVMYLFVHVVKAKGLGAADSAQPYYVAVQVGEHRLTTELVKLRTKILEWNKVFAFTMDEIPKSSNLEVLLQDKSDECVGRVLFDLRDVRVRLPGEGLPKAKWYEIEDVRRRGTAMWQKIGLAVWKGTEDDEAFLEAWHAGDSVSSIQPKVYETPSMWYLRVGVIQAENLLFAAGNDSSDAEEYTRKLFVKAQLFRQVQRTRSLATPTLSPMWNEEFLLVAVEPFDEMLILTLEESLPLGKNSVVGTLVLPLKFIDRRSGNRAVNTQWFNLHRTAGSTPDKPAFAGNDENVGRIHLRVCLEGAYHVMEEMTMYTSDTLPADPELQKLQPPIGVLDLSILRAIDLVPPTISRRSRHATTNAYCVAKYGRKWFRTRTILNSSNPHWHEKYSWEVFDPCTVINIGVFGNRKFHSGKSKSAPKDFCIGVIHIRISTIAVNQLHTHFYPLTCLLPEYGVTKTGELQLAVRFNCSSMTKLLFSYGKPLLPEMHYRKPISASSLDKLKFDAMSIVQSRLCLEEPPLPAEVVEHMIYDPLPIWSLRLCKVTFYRVASVLGGAHSIYKVLDNARRWRSPVAAMILQAVLLILLCRPELILPALFLYFFSVGLWRYRHRKLQPLRLDANMLWMSKMGVHPDEVDEELDTFPTSRPGDLVRMRYDRLRTVAGRFCKIGDDLASIGEKVQGIMSWRDPWVTWLYMAFCLAAVVILFLIPFKVLAMASVLYVFRHPRLRSERPSILGNFFKRLPSKIHAMEWE